MAAAGGAVTPSRALLDVLLQDAVEALGFAASRAWLAHLVASPSGAALAAAVSRERRAALLLAALLEADLAEAGAGGLLPPDLQVDARPLSTPPATAAGRHAR